MPGKHTEATLVFAHRGGKFINSRLICPSVNRLQMIASASMAQQADSG
jgi:hypothetical protein